MENLAGVITEDEKNWNKVKIVMTETDGLELGPYYSNMIKTDIKHLGFTLSRYKFAYKMLAYREKIDLLELGCQEGIGALLFKQNLDLHQYVGIDLDKEAIKWNQTRMLAEGMKFICSNFFDCEETRKGNFDAVVSLDVIEHISGETEDEYCRVVCESLRHDGMAIIGTPSIMLSPYACEESRMGHINLYDQKRLYMLMSKFFHNVFIFHMNDEVVHTGFAPMTCYIFALCCNKRDY